MFNVFDNSHKRIVDVDLDASMRRLRAESGRLRRRIDARTYQLRGEIVDLVSWQTYVRRYPVASLTAAFGIGLAASAGLSWRSWAHRLARRAISAAMAGIRTGILSEWLAIWNASDPAEKRG
jgi:hypothetical protein